MALLCRGTPRTTRSCFFKAGEKGSLCCLLVVQSRQRRRGGVARRWTAFTLWSLGFPYAAGLGVGHSSRLRPKCGCNGLQARGCTASPTHGSYPTSGRLGRGVSARVTTACRGLDRGLRQPFVSASWARGPRVSERHTPAARVAVPYWPRHSEPGGPVLRKGPGVAPIP